MPDSPSDPAALLDALAETHWTTAAKHAWAQYQERGRGAIVFPVRDAPNGPDADAPDADALNADAPDASAPSGPGTAPLRYLTFNRSDDAVTEGPFAKLFDLVQTYDPTSEVVLAAVLPDERTVFDVYTHTPAPPDAG